MPRRVAATYQSHPLNGKVSLLAGLKKARPRSDKLLELHSLVESITGVYSRVGKRLKVSRSYVSRVARGERRSDEVERALLAEFQRLIARPKKL